MKPKIKLKRSTLREINAIVNAYGRGYIGYDEETGSYYCADLTEAYIDNDGKKTYNMIFQYYDLPITRKTIIGKLYYNI